MYTVVRQSFVSTGLSEGSSLVGCVKPGEFITVLEKRLMSNHHERVRATVHAYIHIKGTQRLPTTAMKTQVPC